MANYYQEQFEDEEFEGYSDSEEFILISQSDIGFSPDLMVVLGSTLIVGLALVGILFRFWGTVFDPTLLEDVADNRQQSKEISSENNNNQKTILEQTELLSSDPTCNVSPQFPERVTRWCSLITKYATKHNLDPDLVASVVWLESGGNELAYSRSGAVGLMQVMPKDGLASYFMCINGPCFKDRPTTEELQDPEFNIAFGTKFLAGLVRRNGSIRDALKSYGPMNAGYSYSDKVLSIYNRYNNNSN